MLTSVVTTTLWSVKTRALLNTASDNTFIGANSGENNTTGADNVFIGARAGQANTDTDNTFIGIEAGQANTTGSDNTFIGEEAGEDNTTGDYNTFVGEDAGQGNTTGSRNVFIGNSSAGLSSGDLTGHNNIAIGDESGYDLVNMASRNTLLGTYAGQDIGEAFGNTFLGANAGVNTEHADFNTFVGALSGWDNNRTNEEDLANRNTGLGAFAGYANRRGADNVWIGAFTHSQSSTYTYDPAIETGMQAKSNYVNFGSASLPGGNQNVYRTTVIGTFAGANDDDSISLGYGAITDGINSLSIGSSSSAKGNSDIVIGMAATSTHHEAIAIGYQATTRANYTVTLGNDNTQFWEPALDGVTSLGKIPDCYNPDGNRDTPWVCDSAILFSNIAAQKVSAIAAIDSSLEIDLWADNGTDLDDQWSISVADGGSFSIASYATSSRQYDTETRNKVDVFSIDNSGNATISGGLTLNSDERLKDNINTIPDALNLVQRITGVTYDWKQGLGKSEEKQYGLIAQNVEAVIPELVKEDKKGIKSVNYQALIPVLINATQEQQKQIDEQKVLIEKQQQQIDKLIQLLSSK